MEHSTRLDKLPDGLVIPAEFADRFSYDPHRKLLIFRGFMRKLDYDRLSQLSGDLAYLDALQELFSQATYQRPKPHRFGLLSRLLGY